MLSIEKNERGFVVRRNGIGILEPFEKIKYDPNFENFYMGFCSDRPGGVIIFSHRGEFVFKFQKIDAHIGISKLLDRIVASENIVQAMKQINSNDFWTDTQVVKALRYKYADFHCKRKNTAKNKGKVDVLYDIEKNAVENFLSIKQFVKLSNPKRCDKSKVVCKTTGSSDSKTKN